MIKHIDRGLNLKKEYLLEGINEAIKQNGINISIKNDSVQEGTQLIWNIYADYFNYGYFIVECVHSLTDIKVGPYFEWYILKKNRTMIELADSRNFYFKSTSATFADVVEEIKNLESEESEYYDKAEKEYYRQRDWEQECFDNEHFGIGRSRDENDEFNDMMNDFDAWGNID